MTGYKLSTRVSAIEFALRSFLALLPMIVLLAGISAEFLFEFLLDNNVSYLRLHSLSTTQLIVVANFSPDHHFLGFLRQNLDVEGNIEYQAYNRFPPGGYVLMKLVTLPFGDDLSREIYVARLLVFAFFVGAVVLAYWSLCRIISNRWIAAAATLMAFSSTLPLSHNTTLLPEIMLGLFGFALTFHGMVIFVQKGRFRQLLLKACIALLLDWHVLALLMVFILLGFAKEIVQSYKANKVWDIIISVSTSRYMTLGIVALNFGIIILAYNIGNEYYALNKYGRQQELLDLPTIQSAMSRTSINELYSEVYSAYSSLFDLRFHLKAVAWVTVPFVLANSLLSNISAEDLRIVGACATGVSIGAVFLVRHKMLATTAVLAGFAWTIPMHQNIGYHNFEGLYYIGLSLFLYTFFFLIIQKVLSERLMPLCSVVALFIFTSSSYWMSTDRSDEFSNQSDKKQISDFNAIRRFIGGKTVLLPLLHETCCMKHPEIIGYYRSRYYLHGSHILFNGYGCDHRLDRVDFLIQTRHEKAPSLLTPNNQTVFLYDRHIYEERINRIIEEESPLVQGDFDVYLTKDKKLVYTSDRCDENETRSTFLGIPISLFVYPTDINELPDPEQGYEFNQFNFIDHYIMDTKRNVMILDLPDYDIAYIRTGQYTDEGQIWDGRFFFPDSAIDADLRRQIDQELTSSELITRGRFDIHITNDNRLIYIRKPCHNPDISDDFFLHVIPVDPKDLPEHRRQYEFDGLDFVFFDRGLIDGQRCAAIIDLPDYNIDSLRTGQYTDQGETWRTEFNIPEKRN